MIQTYSTTIRRKEMDAVLTCMVNEKIGPGELNTRFIDLVKDSFKCDGAVALRSPAVALKYALRALDFEAGGMVMISALAPSWQILALEDMGYRPFVLDVNESNGLVTADIVSAGIKAGGRLLLLHETNGIMPDMNALMALGIPVIEDISQSAGALVAQEDENGNVSEGKLAGSFGSFAIFGLEERDVITAGGGAVIMAPGRREWIVLKKYTDIAPLTDLLPDLNAALAWVQLKEFPRNEIVRKEIFTLYQQACLAGHHKLFIREMDTGSVMCSFPLVLSSSYADVKQYASRKDVEIKQAFESSVIALRDEELSPSCIHAKSLFLRTVLFPLYPRLTHVQAAKIVKVLGTLP
jgi:perosamine synthetase